MARHKRQETEDTEAPSLDISSLIDVCFLLLIYFIVATTIVQEKKLDMQMPSDSSPSTKPPELDPAFVKVDSAGIVYWGDGSAQITLESDPNQRYLSALYEKLYDLNQTAKSMGTTPIVQLYVANGATNQRIVDVMNVLTKAGIKSVGLIDVKSDD